MHQAPIHPRILLGAWFFAWIGIATTQAQNLAEPWIQAFTLAPEGSATVRVANLPGTYAILYRGDAVTPIQTATDLATTWVPGIPEFIDLLDPTAVGTSNARFYRVEFVSRLHPKDSDSDGMDDVFELTHGPTLDPLRRSDAFEDPDHDGRSNLAEFRGGTHPLLADPPPPPSSPTLDPTPSATRGLFLELSGEGPPGTDIRVEGAASLATNRVDAAGRFVVPVTLAKDRLNRLFVSAIGPGGSISLGRPLEILQDSQPPTLFADFPTNQMILATAEVMVAGRVGDALSGYAGLKVWVHSAPSEGPTPDSQTRFPDASPWRAVVDVGIGPNGTYERAAVPLVPGDNVISVVADDALGNHSIRQINVVRNDPQGPRLVASAGDRQSTEVLRRLTQPIVVRVTQADGSPLANTPLQFEVTRSNGRLLPVESNPPLTDWRSEPSANSHGAMRLSVASDSQGEARVWWTLGSDAGCANNRVCVSSPAISNAVYFCASAKPNSARQLNIGSGHRQKLEVGGLAPEPLRVWASDGLNPSVGVPITFRVVRGGGRLVPGGRDSPVSAAALRGAPSDGSTELTVPTGLTGHASVSFIAGAEPGQQLVEATFPGQFGLPPTFLLEALARDPDLPGTFTGLVLDNTSCPIGGAVCVLVTGHSQQSTTTDVQGRFRFDHVPGGMGHLYVNGRVANRLLGASIPTNSFPSLSYSVVTVPNAANSLPTPVLLPRLNPANAVVYYGTNDLVLTCAGIDGLKFTIRANSMTDERGNPVRPENPAVVSLDQVHHDDVPMPMPDGVAPPFAWTFQPGGAHFDPSRPVAVEYPNMSGLAPGSVAYFLSFNHDTERFEIVASGSVTPDGSTIISDPGSGITTSGWGCNCPPYSVTGDCFRCEPTPEERSASTMAVLIPKQCPDCRDLSEGSSCDDGDPCTVKDTCRNGRCSGEPRFNFNSCANGNTVEVVDPVPSISTIPNGATETIFEGYSRAGGLCVDSASGTYSATITITPKVSIKLTMGEDDDEREGPSQEPIIGVNVTEQNYCEIVDELHGYFGRREKGRRPRGKWHVPEASKAHELYHVTEDLMPMLREEMRKAAERIQHYSAPCEASQTQLNLLQSVIDSSLTSAYQEFRKLKNKFARDHHGQSVDGAYRKGQDILDARADEILRHAASQGWASCPQLPPIQPSLHTPSASSPRFVDIRISTSKDRVAVGEPLEIKILGTLASGEEIQVDVPDHRCVLHHLGGMSLIAEGKAVRLDESGPHHLTVTWLGTENLALEATKELRGLSSTDADGDQIPLELEALASMNDLDASDAESDWDGDGLSNRLELLSGSDPRRSDTDQDGETDFSEVQSSRSPLHPPDIGPGWDLAAGSTRSTPVTQGVFRLENMAARDQFGTGGPGSPPDFVADDPIRIIGVNTTSGTNQYAFSEFFNILQGASIAITNLTFTDVPPQQPETLEFSLLPPSLLVGSTLECKVIARFADNSTRDVSRKVDWTTYHLSNPSIARITSDGLLQAIAPGVVFVTAVNEGVSAVARIRVVSNVSETSVRGKVTDLSGTGLGDVLVTAVGTGLTAVSNADGTFVITELPVDPAQIWILTQLTRDAKRWTATAQATLVRGGMTDLGTLVLAPFEPRAGLIAAGGNPHRGTSLTDLGAHTLAIQQGGNVRAWGYNLFGQIGVGTQGTSARQYPSPVLVGLSGVRQVAVGGAISHSLALLEDHSLYAWGRNDHGQLGRGNTRNQNLPQPVPGTWMSITAGGSQTAGIDTEGALWRWGEYLGRGSDQTTPVLWNDTKRWAAAALGSRHLAAITADGELWSWHEGTFGGATNGRRGQGTQWSYVTAGGRHSLAIQTDGSLWAWGDNEAGQLGNGTTTPTPEPVPVMEPGPWSFVVAGEDHSVAIKADGTLWTWGSNAGGQFGDGTRSGAIRPMNKLPGNEWVYAAAGYAYSLAVKADGTLCSWGSNGDGQLGVGNRIEQLFPQPVVSNARWWPSPAMPAPSMAP